MPATPITPDPADALLEASGPLIPLILDPADLLLDTEGPQVQKIGPSYQGLQTFRSLNVQSTPLQVKGGDDASARGNVLQLTLSNRSNAELFFKLWNTEGPPDIDEDVPLATIWVPAGITLPVRVAHGIYFSDGIWISATTLLADDDDSDPATGKAVANVFFV